MKYLSFKIRKNTLIVDYYKKKDIDFENTLNKTNIVDIDNMYFSSEYLENNNKLMTSFFEVLLKSNNIKEVEAKDMFTSFLLLSNLDSKVELDNYKIKGRETLDFNNYTHLEKRKLIKKIEVYSIPPYMFERLSRNKRIVKTKEDVLCDTKFAEINRMNNYSDIFYSKELIIDHKLSKDELKDLENFLYINNSLKLISFVYYDEDLIDYTISLLKSADKKRILIDLYFNNEDSLDFLDRIDSRYTKFFKKYNIKLQVIYDKEFKRKYRLKEVNYYIFRIILIIIILFALISLIYVKNKWEKDQKSSVGIQEKLLKSKSDILGDAHYPDLSEVNEENSKYLDNYFQKFNKVFDELKRMNSDTVAWITVNNTKINYPVVQTNDNKFYLNRNFYKEQNVYGWVFMDYRNNSKHLDDNTILYGHQDKHGLMFTTLNKTLKPEWYKNPENELIELATPNRTYRFRVFSVYITDPVSDYLVTNFTNNEAKAAFYKKLLDKSIYDFGVKIDENDKIITLSTCYDGPNKRVVLHAKMI